MTVFEGDTAAVSSHPLGLKAARNSLTREANPGLSDDGPALQSTLQFADEQQHHFQFAAITIICANQD